VRRLIAGIVVLAASRLGWAESPQEFYGCPWNADGLANLEIGKQPGRMVGYRFRAAHSGTVEKVKVFLVFQTLGYYKGDGGQVLLTLQTDDNSPNHNPSGKVLASSLVKDPMKVWHRLFVLDHPARLTKGKFHHLVFTNPAPDPINNFVSVDDLHNVRRRPDMQPGVSDLDLAVLFKPGADSPWQINYGHTPIFCLFYMDGARQGQGYIDAMSSTPFRISGRDMVRETFTVSGKSRSVSSVSLRLKRSENPGDLQVRLELADGPPVEQASIPSASIKTTYSWATCAFKSPHVLALGKTYNVVLTAAPGDPYLIYPVQEGLPYGFECPNLFSDGYFQHSSGAAWETPRARNRKDFDMQFYFSERP
jgi:hypothetical protein